MAGILLNAMLGAMSGGGQGEPGTVPAGMESMFGGKKGTNLVEMIEVSNGYLLVFIPKDPPRPQEPEIGGGGLGRLAAPAQAGPTTQGQATYDEYEKAMKDWQKERDRNSAKVLVYPALSEAIGDIDKFMKTGKVPGYDDRDSDTIRPEDS